MKKLNKILLVAFISLSFYQVKAQQDALTSQYFFNPLIVNPGYAGSREMMSGIALYRNQWVGVDGAPTTQTVTLHGPIGKKRVGLGVQFYNDQIGAVGNTGAYFTYAYRVPFSKGKLSFGLQGTVYQYKLDYALLNNEYTADPAFNTDIDRRIIPDVNFGAYYYSKKFYLGGAVTHLIENRFKFSTVSRKKFAHLYKHVYVTSGIAVKLKDDLIFRPSVLLKNSQGAPLDFDLNASFLINNKLWLGASLRNSKKVNLNERDNQLVAIVEYIFDNGFRVGYSFDYDLNELQEFNSGSHEIMLGYDFNLYKSKMLTPRYF